jgi:hypothetical protein
MKADRRTKWTSGRSFLPKNVRYDNLGLVVHLALVLTRCFVNLVTRLLLVLRGAFSGGTLVLNCIA